MAENDAFAESGSDAVLSSHVTSLFPLSLRLSLSLSLVAQLVEVLVQSLDVEERLVRCIILHLVHRLHEGTALAMRGCIHLPRTCEHLRGRVIVPYLRVRQPLRVKVVAERAKYRTEAVRA